MAFGGFHRSGADAPMAEINMIPLIDVMLVLLVIFIITAPLLTHAVKIDLPKAASHAQSDAARQYPVGRSRASGEIYWNGEARGRRNARARAWLPLDASIRSPRCTSAPMQRRNTSASREVISLAARAGLVKIGFVTDPRENSR